MKKCCYFLCALIFFTEVAIFAEQKIVSYTVMRGDWVYKILRDFNKQAKQKVINKILALNPSIQDPNLVYPGQTLLVPVEFKKAVIKDRKTRAIQFFQTSPNPQPTPPKKRHRPLPRSTPPRTVIKNRIKHVFTNYALYNHYFEFAPFYSYSQLSFKSQGSDHENKTKGNLNYGLEATYKKRHGQFRDYYSLGIERVNYSDDSFTLRNDSLLRLWFSYENSLSLSPLEIAPGVGFAQHHYLVASPPAFSIFNLTSPFFSLRASLHHHDRYKDVEVGIKSAFFLKDSEDFVTVHNHFQYDAFLQVYFHLTPQLSFKTKTQFRYQDVSSNMGEHQYLQFMLQFGFVYKIL